jgi:hypothetical protein
MFNFPVAIVQFPRNPFPVAFPWEAFSAYNDRQSRRGYGLEQIDAFAEFFRNDICGIAAFSEAPEFFPEEMVIDTLTRKKPLKVFLPEYRNFAPRETSDIDQSLNVIGEENLDEILFAPPVRPECIYLFHPGGLYHEIVTAKGFNIVDANIL